MIYKRWICERCDTPCYLQTAYDYSGPNACPWGPDMEGNWQPLEENSQKIIVVDFGTGNDKSSLALFKDGTFVDCTDVTGMSEAECEEAAASLVQKNSCEGEHDACTDAQ